jgi:hypothetical protein
MSRTRKDRPYRVKVNDPREPKYISHRHGAFGVSGTNFLGQDFAYQDHCTADEPAIHPSNRDRMAMRPCEMHLDWQYKFSRRASRDTVTQLYWVPARQAERGALLALVGEYNTTGDLTTEPVLPERHGHATFGGGYWD